jgi:fucose 4-O-acetylase-like acetyltransferase
MTTTQTTSDTIEQPAPTQREQQAEKPPKSPRAPLWDNARFVAITLVIMGHATLKLISKSDDAYSLYLFIYLFHIPVFVAVSGYFAKPGLPTVTDVKKLFSYLVVPYVIFETIWSVIHWGISGKFTLDYTTAWWTLWFLIALVLWRLALPYLVVLRFPMTISIVLAVGSGYLASIDDRLSLARAVALMPFFVFGWKLKQWKLADRWLALPTRSVWTWRAGAILVFAATAAVTFFGIDTWRELLIRRFLLYDEQYGSFGYDQWWAGAVRLGFIGFGMVLCLAFLILMPRRNTWVSAFGQATLYIYLLHSFVLYPIRQSGILDGTKPLWVLGAMVLLSIALPFALASPPVKKIFRPVIEPNVGWLFRRKESSA